MNMELSKKLIVFLAVIAITIRISHTLNSTCQTTSSEFLSIPSSLELRYSNFVSMKKLFVECDVISMGGSVREISYDFSTMKILNESVDLRNLSKLLWKANIVLHRLRGFDIETNGSMFLIDEDSDWILTNYIFISLSKLDFYYRGSLVDDKLCRPDFFDTLNVKLFTNMPNIEIGISENVRMNTPICPLAFRNAWFYGMTFKKVTNDRLDQHMWQFAELDVSNVRSNIYRLVLSDLYNVDVNEALLNKFVFNSMAVFAIGGKVNAIQADLFKNFMFLHTIEIYLDHANLFFHLSSNEWLSAVNYLGLELESIEQKLEYYKNFRTTEFKLSMVDLAGVYTYPDEDICLFQNYPFKKLISVYLGNLVGNYTDFDPVGVETCTHKFLVQNKEIFINRANMTHVEKKQEELDTCNIARMLEYCPNETISVKKHSSKIYISSELDMAYFLKWVEFLGPVVTFPIAAALGFFLNLITILIIRSPKTKSELCEDKLFKYILANSIFNCIECLIYQFKLMNICLGVDSVFCSSIVTSHLSQYFAIIVTGFLSEVMKSCSILVGLLFSLQRYFDTSKRKSAFLKAFLNTKLTQQMFFVVIIGSLLSIVKFYCYSVDGNSFSSVNLPTGFQINAFARKGSKYLPPLYFLHYFFNDFLVLVLNLFIDIKLVSIIKSNLKEQLKVKEDLLRIQSPKHMTKLRKILKYKRKVEKKSNAMIIATLFVYFFCRIPELLGNIFFYYFGLLSSFENRCAEVSLCYLLDNSIEYLYMLSYSTNIVFYYKFNSFFKKGFRQFFGIRNMEVPP